ncbi:MAG: class I SAM-dependent methyltransferase [Mycobacteriales bacterium]
MTAPLPPLTPRAWLRWDVVCRLLAGVPTPTVLEIGCGQGSMGARLARRGRYLGVEPDPASGAVAEARVTAAGGRVLHGDHTAVPAGTAYDLVCAFEVLEHIKDDVAALADWVRFVRPGGRLLLSVPAFQARYGPTDEQIGHYRRYEPDELAARLGAAGLADARVIVYGWPLGLALEAVRSRVDRRRLAAAGHLSPEERTAASGRTFQPPNAKVGLAVQVATTPFRYLQRLTPNHGVGLVALATRRTPT